MLFCWPLEAADLRFPDLVVERGTDRQRLHRRDAGVSFGMLLEAVAGLLGTLMTILCAEVPNYTLADEDLIVSEKVGALRERPQESLVTAPGLARSPA
jgi:hypothetical protein